MPTVLIEGETQCVIRIEGDVDIASAAELKAMLIAAISSGKQVQVDLQGASDLDVTAVQLLWCAAREAPQSGLVVRRSACPRNRPLRPARNGPPGLSSRIVAEHAPIPAPAEERR